jgi:hypothetical protein
MRGSLLFVIALLTGVTSVAQKFSAKEFLFASSLSEKKFGTYVNKKFSPSGNKLKNDTLINIYSQKKDKRKSNKDSVVRKIETYHAKGNFSFAFFTSSKDEFEENKQALYEEGFFCPPAHDSVKSILFQKKSMSVVVSKHEEDDTIYSLLFQQVELPSAEKIEYADDLLQFYSHEHLVAVFGDKNVIRDVYYFSEKEFMKCSVLFPRTNRQAVFLWDDEPNMCKLATVIVGGNTNTGSSANYDGLIDENVWRSKNGVYSGMSLNSLVRLNGNTFKFYGKNSTSPYMVMPEQTGNLDFSKNAVILGCLNPSGSLELERATVEVNKILHENLGLYVFMMVLYPSSAENKRQIDLSRNDR